MFFKFLGMVEGGLLFQTTDAAQPVCSAKNTSGEQVVGGNRLAVAADAKLPHAVWPAQVLSQPSSSSAGAASATDRRIVQTT